MQLSQDLEVLGHVLDAVEAPDDLGNGSRDARDVSLKSIETWEEKGNFKLVFNFFVSQEMHLGLHN